jgi:hypothetical protein
VARQGMRGWARARGAVHESVVEFVLIVCCGRDAVPERDLAWPREGCDCR